MASTARPHPVHRGPVRTGPWDLVGVVLTIALAGWAVVATVGRPDARPLPVLALLGCGVVLFGAGRIGARGPEPLVPGVLAVAIAGAFLLTFPGVLSSGGSPTEYGNTNGTVAALGAVAAAAAVPASRSGTRRAWVALALVLVGCVVFSESAAAGIALAMAALLALVSVVVRDASASTLGGLVATWLAIGTTTALAAGADAGRLTEQNDLRVELWARALDLVRDAPLRGVGPGAFAREGAVSIDLDLRWAHHEYLQQAAETGVVGVLLVLAVVGWLFAYLWWGRARGLARTVAGAAALTVVSLHATVDHVVHTAVVPLILVVLLGWATADRRARDEQPS